MKHILFYISSPGFGHLTRSLAIIEQLLNQQKCKVTIKCSPQHMQFAAEYLRANHQQVAICPFNSGFQIVVDTEKLTVDMAATMNNASQWIKEMDDRADREISTLPGYDLILSDIVPEAFSVAQYRKIPSVGISNFTWYEICEEFLDPVFLTGLCQAYQRADVMWEYPFSTSKRIPIQKREKVGLVARPIDAEFAKRKRSEFAADKPLLFISMGGDLSICLKPPVHSNYLYTRGIDLSSLTGAERVPAEAGNTQDYLAACDAVLSKCGWSTVAEAVIAKKPLFIVRSVNGWLEERYIWTELEQLGIAKSVVPDEFYSGSVENLYQDIEMMKEHLVGLPDYYCNNAAKIAAKIHGLL